MAKSATITDESFERVIKENTLVLVDFWAEWCAPCRMIAPILEDLARDYEGQVVVAKLNVDENPRTPMRYRVMSIPTVVLFKNGNPVEVLVGARSRRDYEARIQRHLPSKA